MKKTTNQEDRDIQEARMSPVCPRCKGEKDNGDGCCIVCWNCWRDEKNPYKYFSGTLREYLAIK